MKKLRDIDGYVREIIGKVGNLGAGLRLNGVMGSIVASPFASDTVVLSENKKELQSYVVYVKEEN